MRKAGIMHKILLSGLFIAAFALSVYAGSQGRVNGDDVNVRSAPSLESEIYFKLNAGQQIEILGQEGNFYKVKGYGVEVAYIAKEFLDVGQAEAKLNDDSVNIRSLPTTDGSEVIGQVYSGDTVSVKGKTGDWYIVDYDGKEAYIKGDFLDGELLSYVSQREMPQSVQAQSAQIQTAQTESVGTLTATLQAKPVAQQQTSSSGNDVYGIVSSDTGLNLRSAPTTDAEIIFALPYDAVVDVLQVGDEWVKSSYDGQVGYLYAEFLSVRTGQKPERTTYAGSRGDQIIEYAKRFLGTPYSWAGTNLNTGVDCSGFVYSVMKHFGISLNRTSRDMAHNGPQVSKSELQTGDLVFFDTDSGQNNISHVGIYMGNGQFIHSSSSKRTWGVTISSLSEAYYVRNYVTACRVLN